MTDIAPTSSPKHVLVFEYGLLPPTVGADLVDQQMRAAHRYANMLVEIERERRDKARAALSGHADVEPLIAELDAARTARDAVRAQIKAQRAATRSRSEGADLRAQSRDLGAKVRELAGKVKEARRAVATDPVIAAALAACDEHAAERRRQERAKCGVYWGTYLLIEASADQARKSKTPPQFHRAVIDTELEEVRGRPLWLEDGLIGVQLQGGLSPADLSDDTQLQILMADDHRLGRRAGTRRRLRMRIGSDAKRAPIWAEWPMTTHRPIPPGGVIKGATIKRRRRTRRSEEWRVQIQVEMPPPVAKQQGGAVALNLGWCIHRDGLRVGFLRDEHGATEEIVLPTSILDRINKAASIRSIRDVNLNEMRGKLEVALRDLDAAGALPDWLRARCVLDREGKPCWHVAQWRSADRFARLAAIWRARRFAGDEAAYDVLEAWRYRDDHLEPYQCGLELGARRHRRELYRLVSARIADRYGTLVLDDTDLRQLQRTPDVESDRVEFSAVKRQQQIAAPYELRTTMVNAFRARGGAIDKLAHAGITATCHACASVEKLDVGGARTHTCSGCGIAWDQDDNADLNLLREWQRTAAERGAARAAKSATIKPTRTDRFREARSRRSQERVARDV